MASGEMKITVELSEYDRNLLRKLIESKPWITPGIPQPYQPHAPYQRPYVGDTWPPNQVWCGVAANAGDNSAIN